MKVWDILEVDGGGKLLMRGEFHKRLSKLDELLDLGVTMVVCLLRRGDPDLMGLSWLEYIQIPVGDGQVADVETAKTVARHVISRIRDGGTVLVHCISARDRSALVAALVVMKMTNISGRNAMRVVQSIKRTTFTNEANVAFLEEALPDDL